MQPLDLISQTLSLPNMYTLVHTLHSAW